MEDTDIIKIGLKPCATDKKEQNPGKKTSKAGSIYQLLNIYKLDIVSYIMQDRRYATLFFSDCHCIYFTFNNFFFYKLMDIFKLLSSLIFLKNLAAI